VATETLLLPTILIRGRSFMALIIAPELPLGNWLAALDQQMRRAIDVFADRPIVADLAATLKADDGPAAVLDALDALVARNLRVIGVEGIDPALLAGTRWARLPTILHGRDVKREGQAERPAAGPAAPTPSLLIDRPVRSGQSIAFEQGDVTVIGPVASGAEVIAGGSIHVYGALRGRAIAGIRTGGTARIFCRKLEAELVAVDGLYRTAEHWGADLHGCAVQVRHDQGVLKLSLLD
jgi:septum site-determining protein MinC